MEGIGRAASGQADQHAARLPYLPSLDGLRALAVVSVLLYHAELGIVGGFLGVEVFFVLSGFLITALLLAEWQQRGQVQLRRGLPGQDQRFRIARELGRVRRQGSDRGGRPGLPLGRGE